MLSFLSSEAYRRRFLIIDVLCLLFFFLSCFILLNVS